MEDPLNPGLLREGRPFPRTHSLQPPAGRASAADGSYVRFRGRGNSETFLKEAVFLGGPHGGGQYVATGGDCGNLFVWRSDTGKLLRKVRADGCIVNCVAEVRCIVLWSVVVS